jgi:hypothetical protein
MWMAEAMWVAVTFVAIALTGTVFLLWFLFALLRESAPSTCYWIVPIRREPERESGESLSGIYVENAGRATEHESSNYYVELLENEGHAKECASGLIALDARHISNGMG